MSVYPSGFNSPYPSSYQHSYSHSYQAPPRYSSSHYSNSYHSSGYNNGYGHSYGNYGGGHYGQEPWMGQIGSLISNIMGSIEQQNQYTGYGLSHYPSYPSYPSSGCSGHYPQPTHRCGGHHGHPGRPPYVDPYPNIPNYPEPEAPQFNLYDQYNPAFHRTTKRHTGGGTFDRDFTHYQVTDDGGNDIFNIDGYQSKFVFTGDQGPNTFRVRGESNLVKIKNLGADDTVMVYNYEDLIILDEKPTAEGHAVALLDPNSGNRIILYSDQPDRGTDFLLDRLGPDHYTGLLDEG